jgi:hypothetical protein
MVIPLAMKKQVVVFCLQFAALALHGQRKYPSLTNLISFDELQKKTSRQKLEWTNPDGSTEQLLVKEMAIPFRESLKKSTRNFVHEVYGLDSIWLSPKMIVFHAMGDGDLKTSLEVSSFLHDRMPGSWGTLAKAGVLPNGAHFIVDREGTIYCLFPPVSKTDSSTSYSKNNHHWYIKRHQDGNPVAIGIENVTPKENYTQLTSAQIEANAKLARWLFWFENGNVKFIASHHQFNDDEAYDRFLNFFHLQNFKKQYRTKGRKDIGDDAWSELVQKINQAGVRLSPFFTKKKRN